MLRTTFAIMPCRLARTCHEHEEHHRHQAPNMLSIAVKAIVITVTSPTVPQWSLEVSSSAGSLKSLTTE